MIKSKHTDNLDDDDDDDDGDNDTNEQDFVFSSVFCVLLSSPLCLQEDAASTAIGANRRL